MKNLTTLILFVLLTATTHAQLLSWSAGSSSFIQETSKPVTITANANYGNQGLKGHFPQDVYMHIGVITNLSKSTSDWKYVRGVWATKYSWEALTPSSNNTWTYTIDSSTSLKSFFGVPAGETILKLAMVIRSGDGSLKLANADGSDMYVPVYGSGENVRIDVPLLQPLYTPAPIPITKKVGDNITIVSHASLPASDMQLFFNGNLISSINGVTDSTSATITASGTQTIIATATSGGVTKSDTVTFFVAPANNVAALPAGVSDGINYEPGDTSVTLVLYAPNKKNIVVVGDFSDWMASSINLMNITPDGNRFWVRLTGLTPGKEYAYQYLIDGSLQVADYNSEKILDKYVDPQISASSYPNLMPFPTKANGSIVSVFQTAQTPYNWQVTNFARPDKKNLVIYELLVRDFVAAQNWKTLTDTLTYLKRLGINAIEVMPFNNFEGYSSWGYNSNFFFAPDKVYGTPTALKQFIDACHMQGIAVIMDLAMQDVFGTSPLASMYWNAAKSIPAADNPWLNQYPTHAFNVGSMFNHSSAATIALRNRVYAHWLKDYNIDGFRFDLAGGYTQNNTCDATGRNCNVANWNNYDAGRVSTWNSINSSLQSIAPGSYCILESFVSNSENKVYTDQGMMVWGGGNMNYSMSQATMGFSSGSDFSGGLYTNLGFSQPGVVDYQESHDETRIMNKNLNYGNNSGSYNVKNLTTALQRSGMGAAFWAMMPGPKMLWEFGELGYDYSATACADGITNTCGNLDNKPIPWNTYYKDANRQALYTVYSKLLNLRTNPAYSALFASGSTNYSLSDLVKWMSVYSSQLQVMVYGNFDVAQQTGSISFPSTGTWYNLFTGATINVSTTGFQNVTLNPGEYYVYVNLQNALPVSWIDFAAQYENGGAVLLNWSTANEVTNDHYDIERSTDGKNFTHVGIVSAVKNVANRSSYSFNDATAPAGKVYYRVKQVDVTGKYSFSKVVMVTTDMRTNIWHTFYTGTSVRVAMQADLSKVSIALHDASGKLLIQKNAGNVSNGQTIDIPVGQYAKGLYLITVSSDQGSRTDKVMVK